RPVARRQSPGAASMARVQRAAMRLLPIGPDDGRRRVVARPAAADGRPGPRGAARPCLSLRQLPAHRAGGAVGCTSWQCRERHAMNEPLNRSRRRFVQAGGAGALSLLVPLRLGARPAAGSGTAFTPNAYIRIGADDSVTLVAHRSEMGQRIRTTLAMILCDELDADWSRVKVERATGDARYGDQNTVGDASLFLGWEPLRTAAAAAREMPVQ